MPVLRPCSVALANALASGVPLWEAEIYHVLLADGTTHYYWTSWDVDLTVAGQVYASRKPWIKRGKWSVSNTMEIPTLELSLLSLNDGFAGGPSIKSQIGQGLFDGAVLTMSSVFMTQPGITTTLGAIDLFGGLFGAVDIIGNQVDLKIKGKNNALDQFVPRNTYQIPCNRTFCDAGCTLVRATYTTTFAVGASPTVSFIPWASAPGTPSVYVGGTVAITGGAGVGQRRTIMGADSTGLTLAYPLTIVPAPGDAFTGFQGCDKTLASGSAQSCTSRSNTQHYRGFEFVPPPNSTY